MVGALALAGSREGTARADGELLITSVQDLGSQPDGRRWVALFGDLPGWSALRATAVCNGQPTPAAIAYAGETHVSVSIPEPPGHTRCTFGVHRLTDGAESAPTESATLQLADPPNEITGSRDLGVSAGRHVVELWGRFGSWQALDATWGVTCNALRAPNVVTTWVGDHFSISFDDIGEARCSFVFGYGNGRRTNLWGPLDLRPNPPLTGFGTYLWSTETNPPPAGDDAIESSARPLLRAGFDVVRLQMAPNWRTEGEPLDVRKGNHYKFNADLLNGECPAGAPFLPCAARTKGMQRLFSSPGARVVMLTVADSASWGLVTSGATWVFDDPETVKEEPTAWADPELHAAVVREYRDLALALYETQENSGKTFIISTYESDNDLYCGATCRTPLRMTTNDALCRTACESGDFPHWKVREALKTWFLARHEGIQAAKTIAIGRGISGVIVADAIEISSIRWLHNTTGCWRVNGADERPMDHCPNILDDVVPVVQPDYVSWSAWEGIRDDLLAPTQSQTATSTPGRTPRLDADIKDLKARLAAMPGTPQLIIGEFGIGFAPDLAGSNIDGWANGEIAKSVQRASLPVNVAWTGYDSIETPPAPSAFGLFNVNGTERTHGMIRLRQALAEGAAEMAALPNPPARIDGIVVSAVWVAGTQYDLFEVYGNFPVGSRPTRGSQITLTCNGVAVSNPTWLDANETQVNFRIGHSVIPTRYCSVKFPGTWTHGPKKLWPMNCPTGAPFYGICK